MCGEVVVDVDVGYDAQDEIVVTKVVVDGVLDVHVKDENPDAG